MSSYKVEFLPAAEQDLRLSFEWGVTVWGGTQAKRWLREFYAMCKIRLQQFPQACPIAPESEDLGREIRQFIIDRYRVIFIIKDDIVTVLYVRGAYSSAMSDKTDQED